MTGEHDDLRRAFAGREGGESSTLDDEGVADQLWKAATGELRGAEAEALIDAALRDPDLAEQWRTTLALAEEAGLRKAEDEVARKAPEPDDAADSAPSVSPAANEDPRRASGRGWIALAVAAAAAALVLALWPPGGVTPPGDDPAVDPVIRAGPGDAIESRLDPAASLPRDAFRLRWHGGPKGAHYDVRVETEDRRLVASALDLAEPELVVPPAKLEGLASGTRLIWRVTAVTDDGRRESSPSFEARLQ